MKCNRAGAAMASINIRLGLIYTRINFQFYLSTRHTVKQPGSGDRDRFYILQFYIYNL